MQAMGLKSPAPIQSRLKHLQQKGFISWQEGKARTLQIVDELLGGVPIMGSVAAGGIICDTSSTSAIAEQRRADRKEERPMSCQNCIIKKITETNRFSSLL